MHFFRPSSVLHVVDFHRFEVCIFFVHPLFCMLLIFIDLGRAIFRPFSVLRVFDFHIFWACNLFVHPLFCVLFIFIGFWVCRLMPADPIGIFLHTWCGIYMLAYRSCILMQLSLLNLLFEGAEL